MAKIFLDTNIFIDLVENRQSISLNDLEGNNLFVSTLSAHILIYITKNKVPYDNLDEAINLFILVPFDEKILKKSLQGPTNDLEDNIQLHSAAEAEIDLFLTRDKKLLNLKFFGKMRLVSTL